MKKLTEKQKKFLKLITNFYKVNNIFPTINDLKNISKYKSYNTIYKYIDALVKKNYLTYDNKRKQILFVNKIVNNNNHILIPFIHQDKYLNISYSNKYQVIKVSNNNLSNYGIYKNDYLIVSNNLSHLNNKFVVINDDNIYKLYKYIKKEGFNYLLNNKEEIVIKNMDIISFKVISLIRNM